MAIFSVPWLDANPNEENKIENLKWEPHKDMVEIKYWEYEKIIDDYNSTVKED